MKKGNFKNNSQVSSLCGRMTVVGLASRRMVWDGDAELCSGHAEFEGTTGHSCGPVWEAAGYIKNRSQMRSLGCKHVNCGNDNL